MVRLPHVKECSWRGAAGTLSWYEPRDVLGRALASNDLLAVPATSLCAGWRARSWTLASTPSAASFTERTAGERERERESIAAPPPPRRRRRQISAEPVPLPAPIVENAAPLEFVIEAAPMRRIIMSPVSM